MQENFDSLKLRAKKENRNLEEIILESVGINVDFDIFFYLGIFDLVSTQLRTSYGAIVGLDYNAFNFVLDLYKFDDYDKYIIFRMIKVMEEVFVKYMNEKSEKELETKFNKGRV